MKPPSLDITGQVYGRLTAIRDAGPDPSGRGCLWEFLCKCGEKIVTVAKPVIRGKRRSCGCLRREHAARLGRAKKMPLNQKFGRHVDLENRPEPETCEGGGPCLLWTGAADGNGRAVMNVDGKQKRASHVAWFLARGWWPTYLCHACDNPACVNPNHLFECNHKANHYDREVKGMGGVLYGW